MNNALNYCYKFTEQQNIHFFNFNPLFPNLGLEPNLTHWALGVLFKKKITITNSVNDYFPKFKIVCSQPHSYI